MLKLLDSLPKKTIEICGRPFLVYEPIRHVGKELWFSCLNQLVKFSIRPYHQVLTDKNPGDYYLKLEEIVDTINREFEKIYPGDSYRFAKEDQATSLSIHKTGKVVLMVCYQDHESHKAYKQFRYLGKKDTLTEEKKLKAILEAGEFRLSNNIEYNKKLRQMRSIYRATLDREIAVRDALELGVQPKHLLRVV